MCRELLDKITEGSTSPTKIIDLLKTIAQSEKETIIGKINLFLTIFFGGVVLLQSWKTVFGIMQYSFYMFFSGLVIASAIMSMKQMEKKEGRDILSKLDDFLDEIKEM